MTIELVKFKPLQNEVQMAIVKRIFLFFAVNILVLITISIVLQVLGVRPYLTANGIDYEMLMYFCLVWGMGGAFISLALSRIMAKWMMGVKLINPNVTQGTEKEILDMVYRLARAGGLTTMPEVGIYNSPEVNAFATGPTKNRSLVAVSAGLLNRMNRDEVEGVLGHEITHITNGDMVTMTLLQGIVNAFVMFFARVIAWAVAQNVKEENRYWVQFLVVIVLEILLSFLGLFVIAYYSRIREFRADQGGARLAGRNKMIDALKALQGGHLESEKNAFSSFKISGRKGILALLSTHPPLDERIKRLERGIPAN